MKRYKLNFIANSKWKSVEEFCNWYMDNGMPIRPPNNTEVFLSDDATATCLFRSGQYQVESYLIYPEPLVQIHEHPGVEVIKVRMFENGDGGFALASDVLRKGEGHGAGFRLDGEEKGFILLAVQKWDDELIPTTVAARWKGKTVGPIHESLIKRLYPEALVLPGYADVTKTMSYLKELKHVANS
jgi:hypothetical protein